MCSLKATFSVRVVVNCINKARIRPELLDSLEVQDLKPTVTFIESAAGPSRARLFTKFEEEYLVLMDQDVAFRSSQDLRRIVEFLATAQEKTLICAGYEDPQNINYWGRSYNCLVNRWIESGKVGQIAPDVTSRGPGGVWALRKVHFNLGPSFHFANFWGGEDQFETLQLEAKGFRILHRSDWNVFHYCSSSFFYFMRRAFIQGRARARLKLKSQSLSLKFLLNSLPLNSLVLGFLAHTLAVEAGSFFEKISPLIRKSRPINPETTYTT